MGLNDVSVPHLGHLISKVPLMAWGAALNSSLRQEPQRISFMNDNLLANLPVWPRIRVLGARCSGRGGCPMLLGGL